MTERVSRKSAFSFIVVFGLMAALFAPEVQAKNMLHTYKTPMAFDAFLIRLKEVIGAEKMGVVAEACADCGARKIGVTIPGNRVVMIFHPKFAVRMLKASLDAGIEAPLRLYVTEHPGETHLSFHMPSDVFAPYAQTGDLVDMAQELDGIFLRIAEQATQ